MKGEAPTVIVLVPCATVSNGSFDEGAGLPIPTTVPPIAMTMAKTARGTAMLPMLSPSANVDY